MKKDLIFAPIMLVIGVLLGLLRVTGIWGHIAITAVGVAVLIVYSILAKADWKIPALEITMRALYGVALITGIVVMNVPSLALGITHKVFALLFVVALLVIFIHKLIVTYRKKA